MNGQLISITISDKSVILHITGQEDANTHVLTTPPGHIYGQVAVKCHMLSHVVFEMVGFESGLINNYVKMAVCRSIAPILCYIQSEVLAS